MNTRYTRAREDPVEGTKVGMKGGSKRGEKKTRKDEVEEGE